MNTKNMVNKMLGRGSTVRRQNKVYVTGTHGYKVRFHKTQNPSPALVNAMEEFVDQISWRKQEWGLIRTNPKQGYTNLAKNVIQGHDLRGEDLKNFITELKTRKYSIDYFQL